MLGVRRPGVTVATHVLEGDVLIRARRGRITIVNRARLEDLAGSGYRASVAEYERVVASLEGVDFACRSGESCER